MQFVITTKGEGQTVYKSLETIVRAGCNHYSVEIDKATGIGHIRINCANIACCRSAFRRATFKVLNKEPAGCMIIEILTVEGFCPMINLQNVVIS